MEKWFPHDNHLVLTCNEDTSHMCFTCVYGEEWLCKRSKSQRTLCFL